MDSLASICRFVICSESLHDQIQRLEQEFNSGQGPKTPLSANEPTVPYIADLELNLDEQHSRQLRLITIRTSFSTETAMVTCDRSEGCWDVGIYFHLLNVGIILRLFLTRRRK